ncbi:MULTISPECIES: hypothetical protein [Arthrobacter]|uniref:hypothetical protein n=1 Tax=Arthrobacter TaxID=1663 RepID=UPI0011CE0902|nr:MULTISPECIES: hypothetical protein [Arthrobacter]QYF89429.1 hypothetical protein KY499_15275 [Arthrobacter sp. PAMC25284]
MSLVQSVPEAGVCGPFKRSGKLPAVAGRTAETRHSSTLGGAVPDASPDFHEPILGFAAVFGGPPLMVRPANTWILINTGGGTAPDKPDFLLNVPGDPDGQLIEVEQTAPR